MPIADALSDHSLVLDNDVFTHLRNSDQTIKGYIDDYFAVHKQFPALPSITIFEARRGIEKGRIRNNSLNIERINQRLEELYNDHPILDVNRNVSEIAAYITARLGNSRANALWCDIFIAATALANRHGVATRNRRDYEEISNNLPSDYLFLRVAIWQPSRVITNQHRCRE